MDTNARRDTVTTVSMGFHVSRATAALPQTATETLFTVSGGRIMVTLLIGEVTTIIQNSDPVPKITSTPTTGTAVDVASTVAITSLEVGGFVVAEGDGTALVKSNAGAAYRGASNAMWVCPVGAIDLITGASKTGNIKWELFYIPLDLGATVVAA